MREHAIGTAEAFSAMKPEYIGLLTLMVEPGTPLEKWVREGSFTVLGPEDILRETELRAFPLFCPKCRRESIISVKNFIMETQEARR